MHQFGSVGTRIFRVIKRNAVLPWRVFRLLHTGASIRIISKHLGIKSVGKKE